MLVELLDELSIDGELIRDDELSSDELSFNSELDSELVVLSFCCQVVTSSTALIYTTIIT